MSTKLALVSGVALASVLGLIAATQQWLTVMLVEGAAAVSSLTLSGQDLNPTLSPIAVAGLAAALALTIAGRVFRYLLGALIMGLGAGVVAIAAGILADPLNSAATKLSDLTGITGSAQSELLDSLDLSAWPTITLIAGVVLGLMGLLVLSLSHGWAQGGRKYQTGADAHAAGSRPAREPENAEADRREAVIRSASVSKPDRISDWEMLSDGDDPSLDAGVLPDDERRPDAPTGPTQQ